jgi:hypothetical protein
MSVIDSSTLLASGTDGYQISRSLRFNRADTAYLNWTPAPGGGVTKCAVSMWVKRSGLGTTQAFFQGRQDASNQQYIGFTSSNNIEIGLIAAGSTTVQKITSAVYRDTSAWYHIFFYQDNTLSTAEDRYQLYVNGVRVTAWGTNTNTAPQGNATYYGSNNIHYIGAYGAGNTFDGYITEFNFIYSPVTVPTVADFGETDTITGVWKPKKYAGTYGTNGFYLNFSDNSGTTSTTLGKDSSGNGNNWTPNNFSVTAGAGNDSLIDTPTPYVDGGNGRGNYCTLNPLINSAGYLSYANGNLQASIGAFDKIAYGTFAVPSSGKWYWEWTLTTVGSASAIGVLSDGNQQSSGTGFSGAVYKSFNWAGTASNGDIAMVAIDMDSGKIWYGRNGTWNSSGNPATGANPGDTGLTGTVWYPMFYLNAANGYANFGQRPFAYTPPSGFVALNTQNLPEPSIKKPSAYMDVKLYSGTNASQSITGLGFSPDLIWFKNRTGTAWHALFDSVRGRAAGLSSNVSDAESTSSAGNDLVSFDANGFTLGPVQNWNSTNGSGNSIVAWCWDESATPGFDIVTYTGNGSNRTISHSLGVAPKMIIVKDRTSGTNNWVVGHDSIAWTNRLYLNGTNASTAASTTWNNTAPTSSVFSVGTSTQTNTNSNNYVAYLWSEVAGFSKFGSYTGNGSSDGPFVFCGFRPRYVWLKRTDSAGGWHVHDTARDTTNVAKYPLRFQLANAEDNFDTLDILSNGFKLRYSGVDHNASSATYIFAAFAEAPFKYALAR